MGFQEIVTVGFDYKRTEADKAKVLASLKEVRDFVKEINGLQFNGGSLGTFMKNETELLGIQTKLNQVTAEFAKQQQAATAATNNTATATKKQLDAFQLLVKAQKDAEASARAFLVSLGAESEEYKKASLAAADYQKKIDAVKTARKGGAISTDVPFTINLPDDEAAALAATVTAISELDKLQLEAQQSATAWADAEFLAGEAVQLSAEELAIQNATLEAYISQLNAAGVSEEKELTILEQIALAHASVQAQLNETNAALKTNEVAYNEGLVTETQYTDSLVTLTAEQASLQASLKETRAELAAESAGVTEVIGAYAKLTKQYQVAQTNAKNLAAEFGRDSVQAKAAAEQALALNIELKAIDSSVGQSQRNVGNYTSVFTSGLSKVFSLVRQVAYVLPGIGVAGILGYASEAIVNLTEKIFDFGDKTEEARQIQIAFNDAVADNIALEQKLLDLRTQSSAAYLKNIESIYGVSQNFGEQQKQILETELHLAAVRSNEAKQNLLNAGLKIPVDGLGQDAITQLQAGANRDPNEALRRLKLQNSQLEGEIEAYTSFVQQKNTEIAETKDEDDKKQLKSENELNESILKGKQELYNSNLKILENFFTTSTQLTQKGAQEAKFDADEERKLILQTLEIEQNLAKFRAQQRLSDNASTEKERLSAVRQIEASEIRIIQAQKANVLNDGTSSDADRTIAVEKAQAATTQTIQTAERQQFTIREDFRKRDIAANQQYNDIKLRQDKDFYDKAATNPNLSINQQLSASQTSQELQLQILKTDHDAKEAQLKNTFRTQSELKADEADYQNSITDLTIKGNADRLAIIKAYHEKVQQETEAAQNALKNAIQSVYVSDAETSEQYASDVKALDDSLSKKEISLSEYNAKRKKLDDDFNVYELASQIAKDKNELTNVKLSENEKLSLRDKIAKEEVALADKTVELKKQAEKELNDYVKQLAEEAITLGQTIGDASFQKRIDNYEKLKDASDKYYDTEISNIQKAADIGSLTDQQAADRITVLNASKTAADEEYDRKQKELKTRQARFDKAVSIAKIIASTAEAIAKVVAEFGGLPIAAPLIAAVAAIGAVQVATVLATPIPTYKYGLKGDKPAHIGIYGEAGAELIEKPGFAPFVSSTPTIDFLPAKTVITPLSKKDISRAISYSLTKQSEYIKNNQNNGAQKQNEIDFHKLQNANMNRLIKAIGKIQKAPIVNNQIGKDLNYIMWMNKQFNW